MLPGTPLHADNPPTAPFEKAEDEACCGPDCDVCFFQYYPANRLVGLDEAKSSTSRLANDICDNYNYLRTMLETNADSIVQRWRKMSQEKRQLFLAEIGDLYPDAPAHAHLFNANVRVPGHIIKQEAHKTFREKGCSLNQAEDQIRKNCEAKQSYWDAVATTVWLDSWFLPYLDLKTLSQSPLPLLSLLHCRTEHHPHQWALFDKINIVGAEHHQILPGQYNPSCISFQPEQYGLLVPWDKESAHREDMLGFKQGMYVLTAQSRMMKLLKSFVDGLLVAIRQRCGVDATTKDCDHSQGQSQENVSLQMKTLSLKEFHGSNSDSRPQPKWEQLVQNGFSTFGSHPVVTWSSHTNRHFMSPPRTDPIELRNKIQAAYQDAFDDVWALQTDPASVQLAVKELRSCLYIHYAEKENEWERIAEQVLLIPMMRELWWRHTLKECDYVMRAYYALEGGDSAENRLRYDLSMRRLRDCVEMQLAMAIQTVQQSLRFQPRFEKNFDWEQAFRGKRKEIMIATRDCIRDDPLFWSLNCFCNDIYREFACDPVAYLQTFDQESRKPTDKERGRVSPTLLVQVGDLAAMDEILTAIKCTPGINRNVGSEVVSIGSNPRLLEEIAVRQDISQTFVKFMGEVRDARDTAGSAAVASPALKKLVTQHSWPRGKPTSETAQRVTAARKTLSIMWAQIRTDCKKSIIKQDAYGLYFNECLENWSLDLSDEYKELCAKELGEIEAAIHARLRPKSPFKSNHGTTEGPAASWPAAYATEPENQKKSVLKDISKVNTKIKTHGEGLDQAAAQGKNKAREPMKENMPARKLILVKQSSLPVLRRMFPSTSSFSSDKEESGKDLKWQHFLEVMLDVGFDISQGSGSAVSFEHPDGLGRIVFHQPHSQPDINPSMLRFMGRRLAKWFGWERDLFAARGGSR